MNEFEVKSELEAKRKNIKTFGDLTDFLKDVKNNYNIGYGEAPRAIAQAALATAWYMCKEFGITGFQAGCVMWDFITGWTYTSNKCGLKIVDYDNMLYPQYESKYQKTISSRTWDNIQNQALKCLEEDAGIAADAVRKHWQSIVDGVVPFGYTVTED